MRKSFLNQNMTVESAHFFNTEDADTAKRLRFNIQYFSLSQIGPELSISRSLQPEDGHLAGLNPAFDCSPSNFWLLFWLEQAMHDELIANSRL